MALAQADQTPQRFYSLSTQIEAERKDYYRQLEQQQRSTLDITTWLLLVSELYGQGIRASRSILAGRITQGPYLAGVQAHPVNARQQQVLNRMLGEFTGYANTSKYAKLAKCSSNTALRDIQALVAWGSVGTESGRRQKHPLPAGDSGRTTTPLSTQTFVLSHGLGHNPATPLTFLKRTTAWTRSIS
ncbi:MAG: hypothetical protein R3E95_08470 [Thiolinea sp.]